MSIPKSGSKEIHEIHTTIETSCKLLAVVSVLSDSTGNLVSTNDLIDSLVPVATPPESDLWVSSDRLIEEVIRDYLPELEDTGVIEYDRASGMVHYHPDDRIKKLYQSVTYGVE